MIINLINNCFVNLQMYVSYRQNGIHVIQNLNQRSAAPVTSRSIKGATPDGNSAVPPGTLTDKSKLQQNNVSKNKDASIPEPNTHSTTKSQNQDHVKMEYPENDNVEDELRNIGDAANMDQFESRPNSFDPRVNASSKISTKSRISVSRDSSLSHTDRKTVMSSSSIVVTMDTGGGNDTNNDQSMRQTHNMTDKEEREEVASSRSEKSKSSRTNSDIPGQISQTEGRGHIEKGKLNSQFSIESNSSFSNSHNDTKNVSGKVLHQKPPQEVLFFIHGVGGSSDIWTSQLDHFASLGYEIVCPDLIGHGLSCAPDNPKAYHFMEILDDMELIFDMYCKEKNIVIGHSYGYVFILKSTCTSNKCKL